MKVFKILALLLGALSLHAQTLDYAVYFSRHGVRSVLSTNTSLGNLSSDAWPEWGVPVGYLTAHGRWLMQMMGGYDREYFTQAGLFSGKGCADADHLYVWADNAQRDIETGRALAYGMFPDCKVPVHTLRADLKYPLFSPASTPLAPGMQAMDHTIAAAALGSRIGDNPRWFVGPYGTDVDLMQSILTPSGSKAPKRTLLADVPQPAPPAAPRDHFGELTALTSQLNTIAEAFYLEYVDGMDKKDIGWGRVDEATIDRLMALRAIFLNTVQRTSYTAKAHASNILSHILRSMEQAVSGQAVAGSLGNPGDRELMMLGHDGDMIPLSTLLDVNWTSEGYAPNETPPGSAFVFEVWRDAATSKRTVRLWMLSETPRKMREGTAVSLTAPPSRTPLFVPGCSTTAEGFPCDWDAFRRVAEAGINPAFVSK